MSKNDEKDNANPQYIFGYLEIACGSLIHILPFPGCKALGKLLIGDGCIRIGYQYYEDKDTENRENNKKQQKTRGI